MAIFKRGGIKLFTDLDIDFNIVNFTPNDNLCLLVGHFDDDVEWKYQLNEHFEKFAILAVVNGINLFAPLSGVIEKIYLYDFKGKKCLFCSIKIDKEQPPSYPALNFDDEPQDIFSLKQLALDAAITDDYKKQLFFETLNSTKLYKKIILNCCDDEPYVLSKTAMLINYKDEVIDGLNLIANALNIPKREVLIFKNFITNKYFKKDVYGIKVFKYRMQYPISARLHKREALEKALIVTPEICKAIYRAAIFKEPYTNKVVSVWGDSLSKPQILDLPLGTPVNDVLKKCEANENITRVIASGVISGYLTAPYLPITRYDNSITVVEEIPELKQNECINCGKCLEVCPVGLAPCYILQKPFKMWESRFFKTFHYCIECGCCSYVCPANIPLKSYIKSYNSQSKKVQDE